MPECSFALDWIKATLVFGALLIAAVVVMDLVLLVWTRVHD